MHIIYAKKLMIEVVLTIIPGCLFVKLIFYCCSVKNMVLVTVVEGPSKPENKTFFNDDKLPPLPVSSVEETIERYLDSCKAILNEEDLKKTTAACLKFLKEDSHVLQKKLLERSANHQNW